MQGSKINTVIFDMDGLLLDTEPLWGISMNRVADKHKIGVSKERFKETTGLRIQEVTEYWSRNFPWDGSHHSEVANEILDDIIALSKSEGRVMPGVLALLDLLEKEHFKIGLATSSPTRMVQALVHHFGIENRFDCICSAEEVQFGKPHPAVFLYCAERLGSAAHECLVLEDSVNGVIAAKAARMKAIAVPDTLHFDDPQFSIADRKLSSLESLDLAVLQGI